MASLVHQGGRYYVQFYDADRSPIRKRIPLKPSEKRTAQRLLACTEDAYVLGDYDPGGMAASMNSSAGSLGPTKTSLRWGKPSTPT